MRYQLEGEIEFEEPWTTVRAQNENGNEDDESSSSELSKPARSSITDPFESQKSEDDEVDEEIKPLSPIKASRRMKHSFYYVVDDPR